MGLLVGGDLLEVGVEGCVESDGGKVGLGVVGETLAVEGVLEVLQRQGIVELKRMSGMNQSGTRLPG